MNREHTAENNDALLSESVLDPVSRTTEILFGLIMVLTFTGSLNAASAERGEVRELLLGALGCNIAWGIIDAFFYLLNVASERGRERILIQKLKEVPDQTTARRLFSGLIPESIAGSMSVQMYNEMKEHLLNRNAVGAPLIGFSDVKAALVVFVLVFLSTFPVAVPFMLMTDVGPALRVSNGIALVLLFGLGYSLGHYAGRRAWLWGTSMTVIGVTLVSLTMALGG